MTMTLDRVPVGERVTIEDILSTGNLRRRLMDLGLTRNAQVQVLHQSPAGDPKAYLIRGAVIALRAEDSKSIRVLPRS